MYIMMWGIIEMTREDDGTLWTKNPLDIDLFD